MFAWCARQERLILHMGSVDLQIYSTFDRSRKLFLYILVDLKIRIQTKIRKLRFFRPLGKNKKKTSILGFQGLISYMQVSYMQGGDVLHAKNASTEFRFCFARNLFLLTGATVAESCQKFMHFHREFRL